MPPAIPTHTPVRVPIHIGPSRYEAVIGAGCLQHLGEEITRAGIARGGGGAGGGGQAFLAFDDNLPPPTVAATRSSLEHAGLAVAMLPLRATEPDKSLPALHQVLAAMTSARHERGQPLIALGGGIVGDLAGFAAATYRRGIPLVHCPTTLLAMVDASIGGKTAVNIDLGPDPIAGGLKKNMAGAFHQPALVLIDPDTLRSLPPRHLRAGLAECIKHAVIGAAGGDPNLLAWTDQRLPQILALDPPTLTELIASNVRLKAAIIGDDEREERPDGGRALLNLGHTFAHAIETLPHLTPDGDPAHAPLLHGEAVALGLVAAAETARELDLCDAASVDALLAILARAGLPVEIAGLPPAEHILRLMGFDKKVAAGRLRLILPTGNSAAQIVADPPLAAVLAGIEAIRA